MIRDKTKLINFLLLRCLFTLQMPMDKYSTLHLLLFCMDMLEDILEHMVLGKQTTVQQEEGEGDFVTLDKMDWSKVETSSEHLMWEDPLSSNAEASPPHTALMLGSSASDPPQVSLLKCLALCLLQSVLA